MIRGVLCYDKGGTLEKYYLSPGTAPEMVTAFFSTIQEHIKYMFNERVKKIELDRTKIFFGESSKYNLAVFTDPHDEDETIQKYIPQIIEAIESEATDEKEIELKIISIMELCEKKFMEKMIKSLFSHNVYSWISDKDLGRFIEVVLLGGKIEINGAPFLKKLMNVLMRKIYGPTQSLVNSRYWIVVDEPSRKIKSNAPLIIGEHIVKLIKNNQFSNAMEMIYQINLIANRLFLMQQRKPEEIITDLKKRVGRPDKNVLKFAALVAGSKFNMKEETVNKLIEKIVAALTIDILFM